MNVHDLFDKAMNYNVIFFDDLARQPIPTDRLIDKMIEFLWGLVPRVTPPTRAPELDNMPVMVKLSHIFVPPTYSEYLDYNNIFVAESRAMDVNKYLHKYNGCLPVGKSNILMAYGLDNAGEFVPVLGAF